MTDRTTSRELWARVAAGDLELKQDDPVDLHAWVREVASRLLQADDEQDAGRRPGRIVSAVGLSGKVDAYAALRKVVNDPRWEFRKIEDDGSEVEETRAQVVRQMVEVARVDGLLRGVYADDEKQAIDLLRKLMRE